MKLNNIKILNQKKILDKKGSILKVISSKLEKNINEVYFSCIKHGKIKAWKKHTKMTCNLSVPVGNLKLVIANFTKNNKVIYKEINVSEKNRKLIKIPPGNWFGFKGLSKKETKLLNIANKIHSKKECINKDKSFFNYKW
tara:strand:- start:968 stop:1387 length:420 start_codon:yes stop_codon:yes gene_type:complete